MVSEKEVLDDHELVDSIGELIGKPSQTKACSGNDLLENPQPTNICSADRYLKFIGESVQTIREAVENSDFVDRYVLRSYLDKISSLKGELQGLKEQIFSLENVRDRLQMVFNIEGTPCLTYEWLLRMCLTGQSKKVPILQEIGMPMMGGVNLPQIEVPTFDGTILNWRPFWEQFQAAVHNISHTWELLTNRHT